MINNLFYGLTKIPNFCINVVAGLFCGAAKAVGADIFTQYHADEVLEYQEAAKTCLDELPLNRLTPEYSQVSELMTEGGTKNVIKAKSILRSAKVSEKSIAIFSLVCTKAQEIGAFDAIKGACYNLWI